MPGECQIARPGPGGLWLRVCASEATEIWHYACVHEHVRQRGTCAEHRPVSGEVGCRACFDAGHECPMVVQYVGPAGSGR